jgi:hypothetical protein
MAREILEARAKDIRVFCGDKMCPGPIGVLTTRGVLLHDHYREVREGEYGVHPSNECHFKHDRVSARVTYREGERQETPAGNRIVRLGEIVIERGRDVLVCCPVCHAWSHLRDRK